MDLLRERAHAVGFLAALVNLAISTYKYPRSVQTRSGAADPVKAGRGVLPGCSFAKVLISIYYMRIIDKFSEDHPDIDVSIYI